MLFRAFRSLHSNPILNIFSRVNIGPQLVLQLSSVIVEVKGGENFYYYNRSYTVSKLRKKLIITHNIFFPQAVINMLLVQNVTKRIYAEGK